MIASAMLTIHALREFGNELRDANFVDPWLFFYICFLLSDVASRANDVAYIQHRMIGSWLKAVW